MPSLFSNHQECAPIAAQFHIPYHYIPTQDRSQAEKQQLALIHTHQIELIVLAKYMQILSPEFLNQCPPVINIHHSFLPAFPGANPYQRAHRRGVKIIGATAHYVTPELDAGPIIEQDVVRVSHWNTVVDIGVEFCNKTLHIEAGNDPMEPMDKIPLLPYYDLYISQLIY